MGNLLKVSWRSIWRSRRRTAITVSAIAFALAVAFALERNDWLDRRDAPGPRA